MARITYPDSWDQINRDELDHLFDVARTKGLWFFHNSLAVGPMWFSPDELEDQQKRGQFIWGAGNWRLRDPQEYLDEVSRAVVVATETRDRVADRIHKAKAGK